MPGKFPFALFFGITASSWLAASSQAADAKAKVTFQDQVSAVFKNRCNSCHNGDKQKGGLNLETFGGAMQGGGSGKVIEPGDPENSTLLALIMQTEEPKMPPNSPKIPDAEIDVIRLWIEGGALETSGSMAAVKAKPKFEFKLDPAAAGKPVGPPAMPENLNTEPAVIAARPNAVTAMAGSPWAPLVAIGSHKQVLLYNTTNNHLAAVLPFPEGTINVLKFSRNGGLLLAGGGRGGQSGLAVVWDVKTGKRVFEIGKEYDAVLAADISPDHGMVALGGPSKILRVYNTSDGQLVYESKKHTEWVTAIEFSPDGVLLASGDRNNGLVVWEAGTGREYFDLRGHNLAITDISWRLDSNVVASSSEDGTVKLWEMENGTTIKSWGAHGGGVASVRMAKDGRLVTTGRDRVTRLWDANGGKIRDFEAFSDLALEAIFTHDANEVIASDWSGEVRAFDLKDGKRLANLTSNPAALATRLELARQALAAAEAATKQYEPILKTVAEKTAVLAESQKALAAAQQVVAQKTAEVTQADQIVQQKAAVEKAMNDGVAAAQVKLMQDVTAKTVAEKTVADKAAAEKSAGDALVATKAEIGKAQAEKVAQIKGLETALAAVKAAGDETATAKAIAELDVQTKRYVDLKGTVDASLVRYSTTEAQIKQLALEKLAAAKAIELAAVQVNTATEGVKAAQTLAQKAVTERESAAKTLADLRTVQQTANNAATAQKAVVDQATAAKTAADQALAANKPAIDAATTKVSALKAEVDALALEKKASDAAKTAMATTAAKGS